MSSRLELATVSPAIRVVSQALPGSKPEPTLSTEHSEVDDFGGHSTQGIRPVLATHHSPLTSPKLADYALCPQQRRFELNVCQRYRDRYKKELQRSITGDSILIGCIDPSIKLLAESKCGSSETASYC